MTKREHQVIWTEDLNAIVERVAEHYKDEMQLMNLVPYSEESQSVNLDGIIEFLLRKAESELDDESDAVVEASIRRSIRDMLAGKTYPIETLWET